MAISVKDVDTLQDYISGVMTRADHHAGNVNEIALALVGAIVWKKDDQPIKVYTAGGQAKNVLWVHIGSKRYAFTYNHTSGTIDMKEDSTHGAVLHSFSNATPLSEVRAVFESL